MNLLELDPAGNSRVSKGWSNHPAVKMWRGHEGALLDYVLAMTREWVERGYKTTIGEKAYATIVSAYAAGKTINHEPPLWISYEPLLEAVASTHRQALLTKDYAWYSQFGWAEDTGHQPVVYEYLWPI
jgi:hypothetical protein